jgi:hypothetical protein
MIVSPTQLEGRLLILSIAHSGWRIDAELEADSTGSLIAPIHSPLAYIESLVQRTMTLKEAFRVLPSARMLGRHSPR